MFTFYQSTDRTDVTWKPIYDTYFGPNNELLLGFEMYQGIYRIPDPKHHYYDAFINLITHPIFQKQYRFVMQNKDIDLIKFILSYDGLLLKHALDRHRDNVDIVKIAISQNKDAGKFASRKVQIELDLDPTNNLLFVYPGGPVSILGQTVMTSDMIFVDLGNGPELIINDS